MRIPLSSALIAFALAASPVAAQTLALTGSDGRKVELTAEAVAALPRVTITFDAHGVSHVYEGPLLMDVLKAVGAPTGRDLRGPALASAVLATAADGYQVAYGLAEADPATRPNHIIVADKADGAALDSTAGPFQIVVEGDLRPARSIRQVTRIEVIMLGTSQTAGRQH